MESSIFGGWNREIDRVAARYRAAESASGKPMWLRVYEDPESTFKDPWPSQARFHDEGARFKGFSGPVGSGKSKALVAEALQLAYANPGLPGVIGAPTYPMLRDVTRAAFLEALQAANVPYVFKKTDNEIVLTEPRSVVRFRSLDNPERLIGANLAWFGVDELTYTAEDAWNRLEARLRHPKAKRLEGFASWTPKGFDWVYERFIGPNKVAGYEAILSSPGENKALPADFYDRLKASYDPKFYEQEVLGKYLSIFAGQVYYAFDRKLNVEPLKYDPRLPLIWSLDFNVNPMASILAQFDGKYVHVLQELVLPNSNTPEACEAFYRRTEEYRKHGRVQVRIYGDPAGNQRSRAGADLSDWAIVRSAFANWRDYDYAFLVDPSAPLVKSRINSVNGMLCNAHGDRRLFIDPSCAELIADFEQVSWKTDASGNTLGELDKSKPKRTHVSDALGYYIEKEHGLRVVGGTRSTLIA